MIFAEGAVDPGTATIIGGSITAVAAITAAVIGLRGKKKPEASPSPKIEIHSVSTPINADEAKRYHLLLETTANHLANIYTFADGQDARLWLASIYGMFCPFLFLFVTGLLGSLAQQIKFVWVIPGGLAVLMGSIIWFGIKFLLKVGKRHKALQETTLDLCTKIENQLRAA